MTIYQANRRQEQRIIVLKSMNKRSSAHSGATISKLFDISRKNRK